MIQFRQAKKSNGDSIKLTKKTPRWRDLGVSYILENKIEKWYNGFGIKLRTFQLQIKETPRSAYRGVLFFCNVCYNLDKRKRVMVISQSSPKKHPGG